MTGDTRSKGPFDDRAALEELERLQQSIQTYRRQREQAEGAFEQFVGTFRPSADEPSAPVEPSREATGPAESPAVETTPDPLPRSFPERFPAELPASRAGDLLFEEHSVPAALSAGPGIFATPKPSGRGRLLLVAGVLLALIVTFVVTLRVLQAPSQLPGTAQSGTAAPAADVPAAASAPATGAPVVETPSASPTSPPAAATPAASSPGTPATGTAAPAPAAAAAGPAPPAEIRTVRRAWVRVLVDGRREVERELEADARVPLPAGSTYVVRAGDAGAVHFVLKGQDLGPLGADAQVVTRTFPVPAR
ncbi:MAG: DUF4115 domain-containing protein [Acidobacteriota bacterium]